MIGLIFSNMFLLLFPVPFNYLLFKYFDNQIICFSKYMSVLFDCQGIFWKRFAKIALMR